MKGENSAKKRAMIDRMLDLGRIVSDGIYYDKTSTYRKRRICRFKATPAFRKEIRAKLGETNLRNWYLLTDEYEYDDGWRIVSYAISKFNKAETMNIISKRVYYRPDAWGIWIKVED